MVGIVIGRASSSPTIIARSNLPTPIRTGNDSATLTPTPVPDDIAPPADPAASTGASDIRRAGERRLAFEAQQRGVRARTNAANDLSTDGAAYRLAVVEHLTRTEVLLTSFRAQDHSADASRVDAQFAALSRELLGTTRILLATRRGDDPAITRLLQDLEFVLMQLSQYANDGRRVDLDAINQSLDKRNVIPKLRATIPAGLSASSGT